MKILSLFLATVASCFVASAAGNIAPHDPVNNIADFVQKNKDNIIQISLGAMGGGLASSVGKTFAKAGILVGGAVFVVSNNIVHFTMPHLFEGQEALLEAAEKEALKLAAEGTHFLDLNNDGRVNGQDFSFAQKNAAPWIKKHLPFSLGFLGGFAAGL